MSSELVAIHHRILLANGEDALWELLLSIRDDDWESFDLISEGASENILGLSSSSSTGKATSADQQQCAPAYAGGQRMKAAVSLVLKRYWGLVAGIVGMHAASQWRHSHTISVSGILLTLLASLLALFLTALPVQIYKMRKKP